jgi:hypothetical protein
MTRCGAASPQATPPSAVMPVTAWPTWQAPATRPTLNRAVEWIRTSSRLPRKTSLHAAPLNLPPMESTLPGVATMRPVRQAVDFATPLMVTATFRPS